MNPCNHLDKAAEDALIARAAQHDAAASRMLYNYYQGLLAKESHQRYLAAAGLRDEAYGIASLAFAEAIAAYDATRGVHFAAFLQRRVKMALYTAFCRLRRYLRRTSHPDQDCTADGSLWDLLPDSAPIPEANLCRRQQLRQAIHCLTAKEKAVLRLIYLYGLPQTTIAARLHVTRQAISKLHRQSLQKMRQLL